MTLFLAIMLGSGLGLGILAGVLIWLMALLQRIRFGWVFGLVAIVGIFGILALIGPAPLDTRAGRLY
jgi:hypothetical protein